MKQLSRGGPRTNIGCRGQKRNSNGLFVVNLLEEFTPPVVSVRIFVMKRPAVDTNAGSPVFDYLKTIALTGARFLTLCALAMIAAIGAKAGQLFQVMSRTRGRVSGDCFRTGKYLNKQRSAKSPKEL